MKERDPVIAGLVPARLLEFSAVCCLGAWVRLVKVTSSRSIWELMTAHTERERGLVTRQIWYQQGGRGGLRPGNGSGGLVQTVLGRVDLCKQYSVSSSAKFEYILQAEYFKSVFVKTSCASVFKKIFRGRTG